MVWFFPGIPRSGVFAFVTGGISDDERRIKIVRYFRNIFIKRSSSQSARGHREGISSWIRGQQGPKELLKSELYTNVMSFSFPDWVLVVGFENPLLKYIMLAAFSLN
jgi:hypothetical protein